MEPILIVLWIALAVAVGAAASAKGRSFLGWMLLSLAISPLLGAIGLILFGDAKSNGPEGSSQTHGQAEGIGRRKCPFCAELIQKEAIVCPFCKRDVPQDPSVSREFLALNSELGQLRERIDDLHQKRRQLSAGASWYSSYFAIVLVLTVVCTMIAAGLGHQYGASHAKSLRQSLALTYSGDEYTAAVDAFNYDFDWPRYYRIRFVGVTLLVGLTMAVAGRGITRKKAGRLRADVRHLDVEISDVEARIHDTTTHLDELVTGPNRPAGDSLALQEDE